MVRKLDAMNAAMIIGAVCTLCGPETQAETGQELARQLASRACLRVVNGGQSDYGSGVVVAKRGGFLYALTASHVVKGAKDLEIHLPPDKAGKVRIVRDVDVLADAPIQDVALIRVAVGEVELPVVPFATSLPLGDEPFDATSGGYGSATKPDVRAERVLGMKALRQRDGAVSLVWECRDRPHTGRSGGPLLDQDGRLVGLCSGTQGGKGYYCHLDEIRVVLKKQNLAWIGKTSKENTTK